MQRKTVRLAGVLAVALVGACSSLERQPAVPEADVLRAEIQGIPNARFWTFADSQPLVDEAVAFLEKERIALEKAGQTDNLPPSSFLSISGGGDNGAFGAGLLVGWSARGDRPEFKIVTGVSTGALIAPFAFLGKDYDHLLTEVYTSISAKDIFEDRGVLAAVTGDGLGDTTPLYELIGRYVDAEFLAAVAKEYQRGRFLFIGTANLDAQQPVIWNMGAIAAAGTPESADLFHKIMLASASIPGVFSPVMFDVVVDGEQFQEMHVDGGTISQVFLYPSAISVEMDRLGLQDVRQRDAYIIRNARLDADWSAVDRSTMTITGKALSTLMQFQGIGDLYRIYLTTLDDGVGYNLAYIGSDFDAEHTEEFDTEYMRALYKYGYELAIDGYPWHKSPPGYSKAGQ